MDKREAIKKVKQYKLLVKSHFDLDSIFLYGSFVNDTNREDSDIDVAVIVNNIPGDFFAVNPLLWKLRRQVDDRIEPMLFYKNEDNSGFLEEIKKHGIKIE